MTDNPKPGDATESDANPNYGSSEIQDAQTDPSLIATAEESLKGILDAVNGTSLASAKSFIGTQTVSPSAGAESDITPQTPDHGTEADSGSAVDIHLKNTGTKTVWVKPSGQGGTDDIGRELKPDDDTEGEYFGWDPTDGDLVVQTDSGASAAGEVRASFFQ